jgi:NADH:ubiquinone oxidoreductase subunit
MIFLGMAAAAAIAAGWFYWLSGAIEERRQKLKNQRGITREQSATRKNLTVVAKYTSYVLAGLAVLAAWLHFGFGL